MLKGKIIDVSIWFAVAGLITFFVVTPTSLAVDAPNISAGLDNVSPEALAGKIISIAIGGAAMAGAVAAVMLTYLGFKLKTGGERDRAETKEHVMWVFLGLALAGFAAVIAGFAAFMIRGA